MDKSSNKDNRTIRPSVAIRKHLSKQIIPKKLSVLEEEVESNKKNLPDFFPMKSLDYQVFLPPELANEPFSFRDNGLRPEIIVSRSIFHFEIEVDGVFCSVGNTIVVSRDNVLHRGLNTGLLSKEPNKKISNFSVLNVYDTYGLDIAYIFLKHIYYHKYDARQPGKLLVYLVGSLFALRPWKGTGTKYNEDSPIDILYLSSQIMLELMLLENKQPRTTSPLREGVGRQLPPELLVKIIGSQRISKALTSDILFNKCLQVPSIDELPVTTNRSATFLRRDKHKNTYILTYLHENEALTWELEDRSSKFILSFFIEDQSQKRPDDELVARSIDDYVTAFDLRGCDGIKSARIMLEDMSNRLLTVTEDNLQEVCAWIVQLCYDTDDGQTTTFQDFKELGNELQRLIASAIGQPQ